MTVLGLRCGSKEYTYAILNGSRKTPQLTDTGSARVPKGYAKPQALRWMAQEIEDLCKRHSIDAICMKRTEGLAARAAAFVSRVELEAMVYLVGYNMGINPVDKKVKSTLAKDLGGKGKAKYLATLDTSCFPDFSRSSVKLQEAILAGWSELH